MPDTLAPARRDKLAYHLLVWGPAAVLLACAVAVALTDTNASFFIALNHAAGTLPEVFWSSATALGTGACAFALVAPTLRAAPRLLAAALITGVFGGLYTHALKPLVDSARPAGVLAAEQIHIIGEKLTSHSFPSGHSVTAFALAATIVFFCRQRARAAALLLPLAALVAFSRIAVGAHWPLDVLAGSAGGWLCGAAGEALSRRWLVWQKPSAQMAMAVALIVMGATLAGTDLGYPQADPLKWLLAGVACFGGLLALHAKWLAREHAQ
ncbi:hypothetical protein GCM10025771_29950 [Niveibacterium umoris]|uniref:Membrane-associated phospholipid phosphatase n=1 Tax=Niveibacterium umoris TaxID=1193620 RepID=A0A840BJN0_9RHOO|nr:phosphatase PAP2 family protein [Niveibacterium umoris]MBB4011812.1 membrane-associated phospholipid phosphatase [Niveibacterium umoris]